MSYYQEQPRRPYDFVADKVIGIILIVLNSLIACVGFGMIGLGSAFSGIAQQATQDAARRGQMTQQEVKAATALFGLVGPVLGAIFLVLAAAGIINGYGIYKGAKWGFILGIVLAGLHVLLGISTVNLIGILLGVATIIYCAMRLNGKLGPKPMF